MNSYNDIQKHLNEINTFISALDQIMVPGPAVKPIYNLKNYLQAVQKQLEGKQQDLLTQPVKEE